MALLFLIAANGGVSDPSGAVFHIQRTPANASCFAEATRFTASAVNILGFGGPLA